MVEEAIKILEKYGQEHILKSYERISDEKKEILTKQILSIDFERLSDLYEKTKQTPTAPNSIIEPMIYQDASKLTNEEKDKYITLGEKVIKSGEYAVVMVAGGQGTRLGHNGPKGTFDMGLSSHKTLFEIFCDKLKDAKAKFNVEIPWYIMTSKENNNATVEFFKAHDYFNYPENIETFFKQNEFPMIDTNGKLIINEDGLIKEAADGHGGIFESMVKNGVLDDMKKRDIKWIFSCAVDNPLAKLVDPLLLGYAIANNMKAASVSIVKNSPEEHVGVFCKKNGKPSVIEYTEITEDMAKAVDEQGEFLYGEAHIMMNLFNIEVIDEIAKEKLPYHKAFKKSNYINEAGELVIATEPNAYKFESFIFDAFDRLNELGVLRYKREECFAPIKNAEGNDSPETSKRLYEAYYKMN